MSGHALLLLGRLLLLGDGEPPRAGDLILYLAPPAPRADDARALLDTVAIYTRDLGIRVEAIADAPGPDAPAGRERLRALLRARGARLAFWCVRDPSQRSVELHSLDADGAARQDVVHAGATEDDDLDRAVALKLRATLTGEAGPPSPPPAPPPAPPAAIDARAAAPPPAPGPGRRRAIAVGYGVALAPQPGTLRQALALQGSMELAPPSPFELALGVDLGLATDQSVPEGVLSLYDVPLRLAGRFVHGGARLSGGAGLFAGVHLLSATATSPDGRRDTTLTATGGFGLEAVARGLTVGRFSLELRGWLEAIVPRTHFVVGQSRVLETGALSAGLALSVRLATR